MFLHIWDWQAGASPLNITFALGQPRDAAEELLASKHRAPIEEKDKYERRSAGRKLTQHPLASEWVEDLRRRRSADAEAFRVCHALSSRSRH